MSVSNPQGSTPTKIELAMTCDKGCGHTVDYETCFAHQCEKIQQLINDTVIRELSDVRLDYGHRQAETFAGGKQQSITDRIKELKDGKN